MTTIAIIYIPAHAYHAYADQCLDYCDARGYQLAGVVCGNWHAAVTMLATSAVDVLILARPEQLEAEIRGQAGDTQKEEGPDAGVTPAARSPQGQGGHRRRRAEEEDVDPSGVGQRAEEGNDRRKGR